MSECIWSVGSTLMALPDGTYTRTCGRPTGDVNVDICARHSGQNIGSTAEIIRAGLYNPLAADHLAEAMASSPLARLAMERVLESDVHARLLAVWGSE